MQILAAVILECAVPENIHTHPKEPAVTGNSAGRGLPKAKPEISREDGGEGLNQKITSERERGGGRAGEGGMDIIFFGTTQYTVNERTFCMSSQKTKKRLNWKFLILCTCMPQIIHYFIKMNNIYQDTTFHPKYYNYSIVFP